MRIAKPMLLITTPIGLAIGLYEGWRLAGGLVFIMGALMLVIGAAFGTVIYTIRKERAEEERRRAAANDAAAARDRKSSPLLRAPLDHQALNGAAKVAALIAQLRERQDRRRDRPARSCASNRIHSPTGMRARLIVRSALDEGPLRRSRAPTRRQHKIAGHGGAHQRRIGFALDDLFDVRETTALRGPTHRTCRARNATSRPRRTAHEC